MLDDQMTGATEQFAEGTTVYDADGEKIGTVSKHEVQGQYLILHKGWLFPKDIYVPLASVQRQDADGVYLNIYKADITDNPQYEHPPIGGKEVVNQVGTAGATGTTTARAGMATGAMGVTEGQDIRVPVREEELVVGTREEEVGRVHLHKDVVEEQQSIPVTLRREEVTVERVPVQGQADLGAADMADAFVERDIDVPVMGEEAVVQKQARVAEEVRLRKQEFTEQEQISDTVRKERVTIEGDDDIAGAAQRMGNRLDSDVTTTTTTGTGTPIRDR